MSELENLKESYTRDRDKYLQLEEEARYCLIKWLKEAHIKVHTVTARTKTIDSYTNKIVKFEKEGKDPSDILDIVGTRIVCLFLTDIEKVETLIRDKFDVISSDNKIRNQDDDVFGYMSDHYLVKLKGAYAGPRYDDIKPLTFEIQVRTMSMDAWAALSHYLDYKSEVEVPKALRKSFHALSGLFYVADKTFENIYINQKEARSAEESIEEQSGETQSDELSFDALKEILQKNFSDRKHSSDYGDFYSEVKSAGISKISSFKILLENSDSRIKNLESNRKGFALLAGEKLYYTDVGAARAILRERSPEYKAVFEQKVRFKTKLVLANKKR